MKETTTESTTATAETPQQEFCPDDWRKQYPLTWETDRWLKDPEAVKARHEAQDARSKAYYEQQGMADRYKPVIRGATNDRWLFDSDVPRTCSFCGGIHPDDAIALIEAGWEVESTDKGYKRYLNPPGHRARMDAFFTRAKGVKPGSVTPETPETVKVNWSPTPPVKLYTYHFTEEHVKRFNAALLVANLRRSNAAEAEGQTNGGK